MICAGIAVNKVGFGYRHNTSVELITPPSAARHYTRNVRCSPSIVGVTFSNRQQGSHANRLHRLAANNVRNSPLDRVIDSAQIAAKKRPVGSLPRGVRKNDVYCLMNIIQPQAYSSKKRMLQGRLPVQGRGSMFCVHEAIFAFRRGEILKRFKEIIDGGVKCVLPGGASALTGPVLMHILLNGESRFT